MSATRPISTKTNASTLASTGLSMKKREIMPVRSKCSFGRRVRQVRRDRRQLRPLRSDLCAWNGPLNPLGHHPIGGAKPRLDDPKLAYLLSGFHDSALNDIVRADHQDIAAFLAHPDRIVSRQQRLLLILDWRPHPHEHTRQKHLI